MGKNFINDEAVDTPINVGVLPLKYTNVILALFVILLVGCAPTAPKEEKAPEAQALAPVKIGVIAPLVGDASAYGEDVTAAVNLALQEINSAGGVNGRQLQAIFENGGCNGKDANTAATKLIDVDKVPVIVGGYCSSETLAAAPLAEAAKVALVSPASSNPSITTAGDFVFRITPSDAGQGKAIADEIIKRGYHKAAVVYMNSDYNLGLATAFKDAFEKLGGKIVAWETYEQDAKDFRTQIVKVRASQPEAIYLVPYGADAALIIKQITELKMKTPLFGSETFGSKDVVEAAGKENLEGLVYATPKFDAEAPKAKGFLAKAQQVRGSELSLPTFAADAYDAVYLIAEALKQKPGEEPSGAIVKDYLYTVKEWDGAGGMLTIDSNGDALKDYQIMYIHEGNFEKAP